jgi:hypothetical protein
MHDYPHFRLGPLYEEGLPTGDPQVYNLYLYSDFQS